MTHQEYAYIFKALSHPSRLRLLRLVATEGEMTVSQLSKLMPREESTVSRHLNILNLHGLVSVRQEGQNRFYSLNPDTIREVFGRYLAEDLLLEEATR
jgi:DNA-binding transcriptional ArsR family regulator